MTEYHIDVENHGLIADTVAEMGGEYFFGNGFSHSEAAPWWYSMDKVRLQAALVPSGACLRSWN
ncbi:hypothetical protein DPPLL_15080 [Desulfofustis limnaeus]|uniref:Uncharacterized protein n=1 Tax=Desulfofustis limnaeus TaxID=2740163 RepID=A0ABN6M2M3_9BACT|nr:hypothetical protein DPPLL_15080 [Desulfofustis limnaeus]